MPAADRLPAGRGPGAARRGNASWPLPNLDLGNTRDASDSPIDSRNGGSAARGLERRRCLEPGTFGNASTNPIVVGGAVYLEDLSGNVRKFDQRTGALVWTSNQSDAGKPMIGPNGVAVDRDKVFAVSGRGDIVALDATTGAVVWRSTVVGTPSLGIDIQPTTYRGKVYAATVPVSLAGIYHGGDAGIVFALERVGRIHGVVVRHGGQPRPVGQPDDQLRRRRVVPAGHRRAHRLDLLGDGQPGALPGRPGPSRAGRAARATTSTPARRWRSTP